MMTFQWLRQTPRADIPQNDLHGYLNELLRRWRQIIVQRKIASRWEEKHRQFVSRATVLSCYNFSPGTFETFLLRG